MMKYILILALLCPGRPASAQEEFIQPSKFLTKLYFKQLTGGVILLQGQFDKFPDTLNFIFDTGSGGISLDSATAAGFKLKATPSDRVIRGIGGIKSVSFLNNRKLIFPHLVTDSLNFHINDYSILNAVYGEKIDGIIGYSFLSRYIVKVDYDSMKLEIWSRGSFKYPRGGFLLRPNINSIPTHNFRVKDDRAVNARFLLDMGAGLNVMLSRDFLKDSSLLDKKRKFYAKEAEGLGGKVDMHMTVMKELRVGPFRFRNVPIYVFEDSYNITSYPYLGGLIGNDILRRFNIILNYDRRDFYLVPNKHFNDPFDYSYSGLELYYEEEKIIVGDVAAGSPAEKAGIKEGDVVVAVNKNFNQNLQQYKAEIQSAGDRLKIIIQRNGELMDFEFKIKKII